MFVLIAGFAAALSASAAKPVGKPVAAVTLPLESVTASLASVTVSETSVSAAVSAMPPSTDQLAETVRSAEIPESDRLAALAKVPDQDAIFRLMFKPGCDTNVAVRVAALKSMVEMDVVRYMETNCADQRVCKAARERIESVYGKNCNRRAEQCKQTVRAYVRRMRNGQ